MFQLNEASSKDGKIVREVAQIGWEVSESFYKIEGIWKEKSKKITQLILILFHLKLNSKHLTTIIHSFRQENSNNYNFRFILMAVHVKNVIPVTTTMNLIS